MKDHSTAPSYAGGPRKSRHQGGADAEVLSITNAAAAHSDDMHARFVKYAVAMGIRMVCIILIFVVDGWFKIIPVVGAVLLPWVAVVIANGGSDTNHLQAGSLLEEAPQFELADTAAAPEDETGVVLEGEVIFDPAAGDAHTNEVNTDINGMEDKA